MQYSEQEYIVKNLKQITELCESDCPMMAAERLKWLVDEIELKPRTPWWMIWKR